VLSSMSVERVRFTENLSLTFEMRELWDVRISVCVNQVMAWSGPAQGQVQLRVRSSSGSGPAQGQGQLRVRAELSLVRRAEMSEVSAWIVVLTSLVIENHLDSASEKLSDISHLMTLPVFQ